MEDAYFAHIGLRVHVNVFAVGKGYFSLFSNGDLHKYSAIYHPPNETPNHVAALVGDSKTRVKVGSGWPWIIFSGLKSERVTAGGTLKTTTTGKYEIKGKGKLDTSGGGGSGSAGGVSAGTSAVSGSGGWIYDTTTFRVSVLDIRPSRPDTPSTNSESYEEEEE